MPEGTVLEAKRIACFADERYALLGTHCYRRPLQRHPLLRTR